MSLFGSLASGVSGLTAQSSAMGAISDNITNINTIGFKGTKVNFQTLVTKQTSSTFYSAGGVQSKPRQDTGIQGLLQASTGQTDLAISGRGFFVVNEANKPGVADQYLFTRAGSFYADDEGYLRNTAGYYLQGWPTTAAGVVTPANTSLTIANQNIISTDYLSSVNLNRVGGSAAATTNIAIGANLPSTDATAASHKTDVQFFDSLGNANTASFLYTKTNRDNQWNLDVSPPTNVAVVTIKDGASTPLIYKSVGQLEFTARPADGATVIIDNITYEFDSNSSVTTTATLKKVDTSANTTLAQDVAALVAAVKAHDSDYTNYGSLGTYTNNRIAVSADNTATVIFTEDGTGSMSVNPAGLLSSSGAFVVKQESTFTVDKVNTKYSTFDQFTFGSNPNFNDLIVLNGITYEFNSVTATAANSFTVTQNAGLADTITAAAGTFSGLVVGNLVTTTGFTNAGNNVTAQAITAVAGDGSSITFADGVLTGATEADTDAVVTKPTSNTAVAIGNAATAAASLAATLASLETAIETADPDFAASGTGVRIRASNDNAVGGTSIDTLVLESLSKGSYNIKFDHNTTNAFAPTVTSPDAATTYADATNYAIDTAYALVFSSSGLLSTVNVKSLEIRGFANGAADMDGAASNSKLITLDFGTVGEANGMTQFGASYTPVFITQNGSQFGTFAGVQISQAGLVTALFDNGETRPVYQLPIATFTNVNGLEGKSGNVWSQTQYSGDYTLRVANSGPAGAVIQSTLEQSTVDIGEEFTSMIIVQRAYSAAAKIISTADAMLEQLMQVKR